MTEEQELTAKLGAAIHGRAHRHGFTGGIDCADSDLPPGHPPCYRIAEELAELVPPRRLQPARDWNDGYLRGGLDVGRHLQEWVDSKAPSESELRAKLAQMIRRFKNGDPAWRA